MRFFTRHSVYVVFFLIMGCGSSEQDGQTSTSTEHEVSSPAGSEASVLIVTASEKYESLMIRTMDDQLENVYLQDTLQLSSREGILCQNQPKNPDLHYGFQANQDLSKYYIAMYEGNMMRDEFEWCRLYEYDPNSEEWTQLISFGEIYQPIWKYIDESNSVIYIDRISNLLLSHSLESGTTDTIKEVIVDMRQHAFSSSEGKLQLTYADSAGVHQLIYEAESRRVEESFLAPPEEFSSIYEDYVLQVYFTDPENQGFRLYENEDLIADQEFKVGNVNSFWNEKGQFYLQGEQHIFLMNLQLDTLQQIQLNSPFIYNVLDEYVLAHERSSGAKTETQAYRLSKDLSGKEEADLLGEAAWTLLVRDI